MACPTVDYRYVQQPISSLNTRTPHTKRKHSRTHLAVELVAPEGITPVFPSLKAAYATTALTLMVCTARGPMATP